MGCDADSPAPLLRPSPATDHDAEKLDVEDPDLDYDAENFPYRDNRRDGAMRCNKTGKLSKQ
jgi:hypothetical protein